MDSQPPTPLPSPNAVFLDFLSDDNPVQEPVGHSDIEFDYSDADTVQLDSEPEMEFFVHHTSDDNTTDTEISERSNSVEL